MNAKEIAEKLNGKKSGDGYVCSCPCPAHKNGDSHASLSLRQEGNKVLAHCFAGGSQEEVIESLKAIGAWETGNKKEPRDIYPYLDEEERLVFEKIRNPGKEFFNRRPDGTGGYVWNLQGIEKRPLYRLPQVLKAIQEGTRIITTEGEKDVHTWERLGFVATTNFDGAGKGKWKDCYSEWLRDASVVLCGDNDKAGEEHTEGIANSLFGTARAVSIARIPTEWNGKPTKDVTDLLNAGATPDEVRALIQSAVPWQPSKEEEHNADVVSEPEWEEPLPLDDDMLPVQPLCADLIPDAFKEHVADVSRRMSCPLEFPAIAVMVMLSSLLGTRCTVRPKRFDDWPVYPNVWGGIVAPPGGMKTAGLQSGLSPLRTLQSEALREFEGIQSDEKARFLAYKAKAEALEGKLKAACKKNDELEIRSLQQEIAELGEFKPTTQRRYMTQDASIEKMGELLRDNPRGMLVFRDELLGLLKVWEAPGHESDRAFFLEAWNGGNHYVFDRIGRGTVVIKNNCLSILGGIQGEKLSSYLYPVIKGYQNDGLIQRFQLLVYPDPKPFEIVDSKPDEAARIRALEAARRLDTLNFEDFGAQRDFEDQVPYFHFAEDAQELFFEWLGKHQKRVASEREPIIKEHLDKYRKLMPALALIIHSTDIADGRAQGPITSDAAFRAWNWCDFLEQHARRIYGLILQGRTAAGELLKRIRAGKLENPFTIRDVYKKEWSLLKDPDSALSAVSVLVEKRICRKLADGKYGVNPRALSGD